MKNVIVFHEILEEHPQVEGALSSHDLNSCPIQHGREVMEAVTTLKAVGVILDVAMPKMSGIEACRQLKEEFGSSSPPVILVSSIDSESVAGRAREAACDLYVKSSDIQPLLNRISEMSGSVAHALREKKAPQEGERKEVVNPEIQLSSERRVDTRNEVSGPLIIMIEAEEEVEGEFINASRSGVLFAAPEEIPPERRGKLKFFSHTGEELFVNVIAVRSALLKDPVKDLPYGIGARFAPISEGEKRAIQYLITAKKKVPPKIHAEYLIKLLKASPDLVAPYVLGPEKDPVVNELLGEVTDFEKECFQKNDSLSLACQELVTYRLKASAFVAFLPAMIAGKTNSIETFMPMLCALLDEISAAEDRLDEEIRKLNEAAEPASEEEELENEEGKEPEEDHAQALREHINEVSNVLHEKKTKLIFSAALDVPKEGVGDAEPYIKTILEKAEHLQGLSEGSSEDLARFQRRSQKPQKKEKEKKKKKIENPFKRKSIQMTIAIFAVLIGAYFTYDYYANRVTQSDLDIGLVIQNAKTDEVGLVVHVLRQDWENLPSEGFEEVFQKTEEYLKDNRISQMKIVDENGKLIAAIISARMGKQIHYERRIF